MRKGLTMFSLKKLSLALLAASFFSVAQAEEPKQLLVPELYRQNQFINEPEAEFSLQQDESLENVIIHSGYNLQVKRLTAENLPLLQGLIQSQIQPSITGNLDIKNTSQDLFNLRMGNELSYQPKTVSINIWFTGSSKIEIGDNAFLYRSEGMLENSFLRIQPSPNPGEHRLNLTGIVQLSNERVYINLGTNGEWKGGNYAASLPAEPNPKANTYLDLGKNGIFISAAKNNQPIAFSGSGTILFKEGEAEK